MTRQDYAATLRKQGYRYREIAASMGIDAKEIKSLMRKAGYPDRGNARIKKLPKAYEKIVAIFTETGCSERQISQQTGVSLTTVDRAIRHYFSLKKNY